MSIDLINQTQSRTQRSTLSTKTSGEGISPDNPGKNLHALQNKNDISLMDKKGSDEFRNQEDIKNIVKDVNEKINVDQMIHRELKFSIDESSKRTVITVLDKKTDEIIRQIPTEQLLELEKELSRRGGSKGLLMKVVA